MFRFTTIRFTVLLGLLATAPPWCLQRRGHLRRIEGGRRQRRRRPDGDLDVTWTESPAPPRRKDYSR